MPFLRDEGPPVSKETIEEARRSLPYEYGHRFANEKNREVLLVRVPKAKPDYLHELTEVALYVGLDEIKATKDVLLVGDEKVCRLEPVLLRDHIRERKNEDAVVVQDLVKRLSRDYGYTVVDHKFNLSQHSVAVRIPRESVAEISAEDVQRIRAVLQPVFQTRLGDTQAAYILADRDFERLGRRVFLELVDPEAAERLRAARDRPTTVTGILLDKTGSAGPTGVMPSGGLPMPGTTPATPPQTVVKPVFTARQPRIPPAPAMPTDPVARAFVSSALAAPPEPPAPAAPPEPETPRASVPLHQTEEFEVFVARPRNEGPSPTPAYAPEPRPQPAAAPPAPAPAEQTGSGTGTGFVQTVHNEEFEVFVSKRVQPEATPVERLSRDEVTDIVARAARPPSNGTQQDSGGPVVIPMQRIVEDVPAVATLDGLADELTEAGYRVVRDLHVEGTVFDLAAHRDGGKRVLAKMLAHVDAAQVRTLASVTDRLGADVCLAVSTDVAGGARLASWGTRVEVLTPEDVDRLEL